ncbi:Ankyrin repeat-containing protein [Colletotrichum asianum]
MAEALSLVASVIAVADVAVKAGSAYVKITRLWDEVKQVPATLREKAEEIQLFEEFLLDTERSLSQDQFPELTPNRVLLERLIERCYDTLTELKDSVERIHTRVANHSRLKRKIASAKSVLNKDDLEALTSRFDRALNLFQRAQDQQRHWM